MAHLALLIDADSDRRERFVDGVRSLFSELPNTVIAEAHSGPVRCLWAAGPRAPINVHAGDGHLAVLIGYAVDDAGQWVTADELADAWLTTGGGCRVHDGYHVGIAYDTTRGFAAGNDPLGLFPLYHATLPDGGVIVATTPQAFTCHPGSPWRIDRTGLAGILLAHGLLDDRPLLAGVKRVAAGHRLRMAINEALSEIEVFRFAGAAAPPGETFADAVVRIDAELVTAIRRHRPLHDDALLMLSGGLDSRLVAACLADEGVSVQAVSFGRPRDFEVRAAMLVAEQLGMPIEVVSTEHDHDDFVARTRRSARFSHLSSAPSGDDFAAGLANAATTARFSWSGIPLDWVLEPVSRHNGYDAEARRWSFNALVHQVNAWGVPRERLPSLLGRDGAALCDDLIQRMESFCLSGPLPPERQSAVLRWNQRVRNHLAAALHMTSFVTWPLTVVTDRQFFTAAFGLPVEMFANRRIEKAMLTRRRPDLAVVPLDTNSFQFESLGGARRAVSVAALKSFGRRIRRAVQPFMPGSDPRRYERVFNVDQPRWRRVRRAAEPLRGRLESLLDATVLAEVFPPPSHRLRSRKPLMDGSPIRLLAGLAFVLDQCGP
jgi:hypothetical protein